MSFFIRALISCVVLLSIGLTGCGRKTLPIPPQDALPQAISDLSFIQDENKIVLRWTAPKYTTAGSKLPNIDAFEISRAVVPEKDYCQGCPVKFTSSIEVGAEDAMKSPKNLSAEYTEMVLRPGHRFIYKVRTKAGWRLISDDSNIVSFSWNSPAQAPEGLTAIPGDMKVMLSWLPVTTLIDEQQINMPLYQVYRGRSKDDFSAVGKPVSVPAFTDTGLQNGQSYYYKVNALQLRGETQITGLSSRAISATPEDMTAPAPPRGVKVVQLASQVKVLWEQGAEKDIAGYNIYRRSLKEKNMTRIGQVNQSRLSYTDTAPEGVDGLYYAVTAYDTASPANESSMSKESLYEPF